MNKLVRISATVASSLALVAGFSGVAGAASIDNNGRDSHNYISHKNIVWTHVDNDTNVHLYNHNDQHAYSGDAHVEDNNNVHSVSTGDATNSNTTTASVAVDNSSSSSMGGSGGSDTMTAPDASINNDARDSHNSISSLNVQATSVDNDTTVCLTNTNDQHASSGDAKVEDNNNVGSVTTGDASNTNSSTFTLNVTN